ncbi:hypothetical protein Acr_08g0011790 [Actinidia rufa]|uniref:Uncharacterized protein n=1 Tax=Actinidia rufa TaxID=165716 RepID=A0A7J0F2E8_9ERIC|nr:hypothetical protein Acr_08g0011790 [Actinidia rufa]
MKSLSHVVMGLLRIEPINRNWVRSGRVELEIDLEETVVALGVVRALSDLSAVGGGGALERVGSASQWARESGAVDAGKDANHDGALVAVGVARVVLIEAIWDTESLF